MRGDVHEASGHYAAPREAEGSPRPRLASPAAPREAEGSENRPCVPGEEYAAPRKAEGRIDAFAAELLLPRTVVGRRWRRASGPRPAPRMDHGLRPGQGRAAGNAPARLGADARSALERCARMSRDVFVWDGQVPWRW